MASAKKALAQALTAELGSIEKVKEFASNIKELGFYDLSDEAQVVKLNGKGELLIELISWYSFGILSRMVEVKQKLRKL